jgi:amidase
MAAVIESAAPDVLAGQPATVLAALVQSGRVTAVEVVRAHLQRITALDPRIGAFQNVRAEKALAEADALASREDLRTLPLAGVPVAIKDALAVAGEPLRIGSQATSAEASTTDHETVRRLRAAGAIIVGTTRVPELCAWGTTDSAYGVTRNPWHVAHTAGGSSGGSAAAVASAMVPLALGSDGLGSIRIPAASCGVFGMKPGPGIVPAQLGVSSWFGLAENGPIATTVEDAALMLSVMAGRTDLAHPLPPAKALRIAISTRSPLIGVSVDLSHRTAALEIAARLGEAGHHVEPSDPPMSPPATVIATVARWLAGVAQDAEALDLHRLEPRTRTHVRLGLLARRAGLVRPRDRDDWQRRNDGFFHKHDLLITPALASRPIACEMWSRRGWMVNAYVNLRFAPFTGAWNFAGYPAASVPVGVLADGLPIAIQIVGSSGREDLILSLARQIELLRPWPRHAAPAD